VLLPLNEPTTSPALRFISGIAGWLLDYVASWPKSTFEKQDFHASLKQSGLWHLIGSRSAIAERIPTLLTLSQYERNLLRDAFYNDIRFYECLDSPSYVFSFPSLPDSVQEIGKAFLLLFYERLAEDGFHDGTRRQRTFTVTRTDIESGYRAANDEMQLICPACLGLLEPPAKKKRAENVFQKRSLVDCEHFFPKSLYPPLIIHPNNLVFVCQVCNKYHNNDDPTHLSPLAQPEAGALRKTFIPYQRSGLANRASKKLQADEVKLQFDLVNPKKQFVSFVSNSQDIFALDRANNFDRVYGISERWGKLVPGMYNTLRDSIRLRIIAKGEMLNRQTIEAQLQEELVVVDYFCFRNEGAYLRSQYIQWIEQHCLDLLVKELTS
jgi:hypothetical protein